jgi:hypothetical protein
MLLSAEPGGEEKCMVRSKSARRPDINEVRALFEQWRKTRQGRPRIPAELWSAAIEVARRDGVNRTAAALHLDGGKLMKQMVAAGVIPRKPMPPAFIELLAPRAMHPGAARPEYTRIRSTISPSCSGTPANWRRIQLRGCRGTTATLKFS